MQDFSIRSTGISLPMCRRAPAYLAANSADAAVRLTDPTATHKARRRAAASTHTHSAGLSAGAARPCWALAQRLNETVVPWAFRRDDGLNSGVAPDLLTGRGPGDLAEHRARYEAG